MFIKSHILSRHKARETTAVCGYVPMPRCRSVGCSVRSSVSWPGGSEFFCCTKTCSYTAEGARLHLDSPSTDRQVRQGERERDRLNKEREREMEVVR